MMEINGGSSKMGGFQRLACSVKNYDWGKVGSDSVVAGLCSANSGLEVDPYKAYAEFWMGTHESGPSFVVKSDGNLMNGENGQPQGVTLKSWIQKNPNVLGSEVLKKWGCDLPFLFKVLSVAKALSIQAHPDKGLASRLHESQPDVYKDDNHKPEMALAITEFEALCGFISVKELKDVLQSVPEIRELVGDAYVSQILDFNSEDQEENHVKAQVKSLFTQLMSARKDMISDALSKLKSRLKLKDEITVKERLVLRLERQYPDDVGVIAAFFMNYVKLKPGQALCLGANELHAYVSGDCIECMATSDNVVRAGLTPKKRDVQTLCSMLTYKLDFPDILEGYCVNKYIHKYRPPFEEFEVDRCVLPLGASTSFPAISGPSIFLVANGEGRARTSSSNEETICAGDVLFVPANSEISVNAETQLELYRAGVNSEFLALMANND
ncbi:Mannose-6-phosphate isomerase [Dionaea muscipula]